MDLAPERSLGNSQLSRVVGIEASLAIILHDRVAQRPGAAMIDGVWHDRVVLARNALLGLELGDLDRK